MNFFADNILIVILLPLWISFIILSGLFFRLVGNFKITYFLSILSSVICTVFATCSMNYVHAPNMLAIENSFEWLKAGNINICFGTFLDSTSAVLLSVFAIFSLILQLYLYDYLRNKKDFSIYFVFINLINFTFSGLILSHNTFQFGIFELLSSLIIYLMLLFINKDDTKTPLSNKFLCINAFADGLFITALVIITYYLSYYILPSANEFFAFSNINVLNFQLNGFMSPQTYNLIIFLLVLSSVIKMAQFPFYNFYIDSANKYSPLSAIVISLFPIFTGSFLLIRINPLLTAELSCFILITGIISAVISCLTAIYQVKLYKITAYIACTQLSLILILLGLNMISALNIFCIVFIFSSMLLYLTTVSVKEISLKDDINYISGIKNNNFTLSVYWLIAVLSLTGIFFGGFTAKDILLRSIVSYDNTLVLVCILLIYFCMAYCLFKAYFKIFCGEKIFQNIYTINRSNRTALRILSLFIIIPGFLFNINNVKSISIFSSILLLTAFFIVFLEYKYGKKYAMPYFFRNLFSNELYIPLICEHFEKININKFLKNFPLNINFSQKQKESAEGKTSAGYIKQILFYTAYIILLFAAALYMHNIWIGS